MMSWKREFDVLGKGPVAVAVVSVFGVLNGALGKSSGMSEIIR